MMWEEFGQLIWGQLVLFVIFIGIILSLVGIIAIFLFIKVVALVGPDLQVPPLPALYDTWWGLGKPEDEDKTIKPYKIQIPDEVLADLKHRLENTRPLVPPLEGTFQEYGVNTNVINDFVRIWKTEYDWRKREKFLNQYPQFTTSIQGLQIHFLHVKPKAVSPDVQVIPLLLLHGWPGSVREFYDILPLLTTERPSQKFVFEVIAPSLPGFGFSEGAVRSGLGTAQIAVIFKNLMERLQFVKFYIQGGDWGAFIASNMTTLYPNKVLGLHSNFCYVMQPLTQFKLLIASLFPGLILTKEHESRVYPLTTIWRNLIAGTGYMHLQATKPDTIGVAMNDSPVGLASYMLQHFIFGKNPVLKPKPDGSYELKFSQIDILDNIMIYWVTKSATTSFRLYSEALSPAHFELKLERIPTDVPTACARFPYEMVFQPEWILRDKYRNLVQVSDMPVGGHFAAFEEPKLLADDVWKAVGKFRKIKIH